MKPDSVGHGFFVLEDEAEPVMGWVPLLGPPVG